MSNLNEKLDFLAATMKGLGKIEATVDAMKEEADQLKAENLELKMKLTRANFKIFKLEGGGL